MTKTLLATVLVLAVPSAACGGGGSGVSDCTSARATKLTGTITIKGGTFYPNCFSVASGSTISVANRDTFRPHNFTVPGTGIAVLVYVGKTGGATAPAPGRYDFLCTIHPSMKGTMIVT